MDNLLYEFQNNQVYDALAIRAFVDLLMGNSQFLTFKKGEFAMPRYTSDDITDAVFQIESLIKKENLGFIKDNERYKDLIVSVLTWAELLEMRSVSNPALYLSAKSIREALRDVNLKLFDVEREKFLVLVDEEIAELTNDLKVAVEEQDIDRLTRIKNNALRLRKKVDEFNSDQLLKDMIVPEATSTLFVYVVEMNEWTLLLDQIHRSHFVPVQVVQNTEVKEEKEGKGEELEVPELPSRQMNEAKTRSRHNKVLTIMHATMGVRDKRPAKRSKPTVNNDEEEEEESKMDVIEVLPPVIKGHLHQKRKTRSVHLLLMRRRILLI
jgi:CRISPR/Cas system-associated protein Cas5 (RAMP superfamily)